MVLEPVLGAKVKVGHAGHRKAPGRSVYRSISCFECRQAAFTQLFYCRAREKIFFNVEKNCITLNDDALVFTCGPICKGGRWELLLPTLFHPKEFTLLGKFWALAVTQHNHFPSHTQ